MRINWNLNVIDGYTLESAKAYNAKAAVSGKLLWEFILHIISVDFPKKFDKSVEQCFTITLNYKTVRSWEQITFRTTLKTEIFKGKVDLLFNLHARQSCRKWKNKHLDSIPVSFFPSTPTSNLKLSGLFIELSNQLSKVKFELPDAEASGFYDQVTYLNSKPLIELSILAVYLAE